MFQISETLTKIGRVLGEILSFWQFYRNLGTFRSLFIYLEILGREVILNIELTMKKIII